jgi:hypothetical protein
MVEAERVLRPLGQALTPVADRIGPISYVQIKETRHSRLGTVLRRITEAAAQTLIDRFPSVPSPRSFFVFQQVGGAVSACTHEKLRNSQVQWPTPGGFARNLDGLGRKEHRAFWRARCGSARAADTRQFREGGHDRPLLKSGMDHIAPLVIVGFVIALIGWSIVVLISRTPQ